MLKPVSRNPKESIGMIPMFPLCQFTKYEYIEIPIRTEISLYNFTFFKNIFEKKFNNKSRFGLLYNFRGGRWSVNSYSDRFENWCRRSGMLVKEIINDSSYKRRWLVK